MLQRMENFISEDTNKKLHYHYYNVIMVFSLLYVQIFECIRQSCSDLMQFGIF